MREMDGLCDEIGEGSKCGLFGGFRGRFLREMPEICAAETDEEYPPRNVLRYRRRMGGGKQGRKGGDP